MKIRNNSLLIKIIFYNDVTIFITALLVALVVIITSFQGMEVKIEDTTRNRMELLLSSYKSHFSKIRNDVYKEIGKNKINEGNQKIAELLNETLLKEDFKVYYDSVVTIISQDGKLLGESGNDENLGTLAKNNIVTLIETSKKREFEDSGYYLVRIENKIYSRIVIPYDGLDKTYFAVISIPIDKDFLNSLKAKLNLTSKDQLIFITNIDKNIGKNFANNFFTKKEYTEIETKEVISYFNKKINGLPYYLGVYNLIGYSDRYLGSFVLAISKEKMIQEKLMLTVYIGVLVLLIMILNSTISSKILRGLLLPLTHMAETADSIAKGEKIDEVDIIGQGEIRTLSVSLKKMLEKINIVQDDLTIQNKELMRNISRIEAIDHLLIKLNLENETESTIKKLVEGFTADDGLRYSRAMYFRYSRENDYFIGEYISVNNELKKENGRGFSFQIDNLNEIVKFIKISNSKNMVAETYLEQRIIYKNDNGYKYNLGNDLLKAIGLKNFFIFPIHGAGKFSGVILVDNYTKDIKINQEELELLNLLAMNVSIGIDTKERNKKNSEDERVETIEKLATRFLRLRGDVVEKLLDCLNYKNDTKEVIKKLEEIVPYLKRIKEDNNSLKIYSELGESKIEKLSLEALINEVIEEYHKKFSENNIFVSFFSATNGIIEGDKFYLKKVIEEILENSYQALLTQKKNRRVDIILSKKRQNEKIELKIIDNGGGISEKEINDIYEPFISSFPQGLGLGLFFVHKIIKDHGGVIKHFSEYGKNTEVKITLNAYKEEV